MWIAATKRKRKQQRAILSKLISRETKKLTALEDVLWLLVASINNASTPSLSRIRKEASPHHCGCRLVLYNFLPQLWKIHKDRKAAGWKSQPRNHKTLLIPIKASQSLAKSATPRSWYQNKTSDAIAVAIRSFFPELPVETRDKRETETAQLPKVCMKGASVWGLKVSENSWSLR